MKSHLPSLLLLLSFFYISSSYHLPNFPIPHPNPDSVAEQLTSIIHTSHSLFLSNTSHSSTSSQCLTGNPIDDCWRCTASDWRTDRQHLADCSIGFGQAALGGRNGQTYVVTDSSDSDPANPKPGTLRYAAIRTSPLWITFSSSMKITLTSELLISSFKTIDGRGSDVHIADGACLTLRSVSNVIIHNVRIYNCKPAHSGFRGRSDGDGISLYGARNIWIDHCDLSNCADGLIDAIMGSTGITISNSYFSHHNEVMLLGHVDDYLPDSGMQVTIAFNRFGPGLVQRMPRCRRGYIHVVNNDYTYWEMYAIGGSANPTINSQGNRYTAPGDHNAKEVTKRVDTDESEWSSWNWRTDGDIMVNGAFFVPSGAGLETKYSKAESVEPRSSAMIDQLTMNAGVLGSDPRRNEGAGPAGYGTGVTYGGAGGGVGGGQYGYDWGMIFGSDASALLNHSFLTTSFGFILLIVILLTSDFWLL